MSTPRRRRSIEERIKAAGYKEPETFVLEHGYCRSVYVTDPNGMIVEFTLDAPNADADQRRPPRDGACGAEELARAATTLPTTPTARTRTSWERFRRKFMPLIDSAFPTHTCLIGTVLPNGFAQITPRGSTQVYDDEHISFWERGRGTTDSAAAERHQASRCSSSSSSCAATARCRSAASRVSTAPRRCTNPARSTTRCGNG